MDTLAPAVLRTLAYFDVFDYPVTADQLWRWLYVEKGDVLKVERYSVEDVTKALNAPEMKKKVGQRDGYFFLAGREGIVATRQQRAEFTKKKMRRVETAVKYLELVPYVRMIALVNTMAI